MTKPVKKRRRKLTLPEAFDDEPLSEMADDGDLSSDSCSSEQPDHEPAPFVAPVTPPIPSHDDQDSCTDTGPAVEEKRDCQLEDIAAASHESSKIPRSLLHLFAGSGAHSDHAAESFKKHGDTINAKSVDGQGAHDILDPAGWDSLRLSLVPHGYDVLLITPPFLTFYRQQRDGVLYRGALAAERDGLRGLQGKQKEIVRMDALCLRRAAEMLFTSASLRFWFSPSGLSWSSTLLRTLC